MRVLRVSLYGAEPYTLVKEEEGTLEFGGLYGLCLNDRRSTSEEEWRVWSEEWGEFGRILENFRGWK